MRIEVEAILFDNDGVLVDSHRQVELAWRQLATDFDLDIDTLLDDLVGVRAVDTLGRHLPPAETAAAASRLERLELELAAKTPPVAGAVELLARLPRDAWTIVTSASRDLALARWHGAGIPVPEVVVTAEDVTRGKPDPEPFVTAARLLDVDPARCLVFEDSPSGGAAAMAAGAIVVAVGGRPWPSEPVARVADLSEVTAHRQPGTRTLVVSLAGAQPETISV